MQTVDYQNSAKQEIEEVFATARKVNPSMLALPIVDRNGRKAQVSFITEVMDKQSEPKVFHALLAVLSKSNCPHVQTWVQSMIDHHVGYWGDDLAEVDMRNDK